MSAPASPSAPSHKCHVCTKTVYTMDECKADNLLFHKTCFRCKECQRVLKLGSYASMNFEFFCKNCFKRNFFSKGNYSEGFGKLKPQQEFEAKQRGESVSTGSPNLPRRESQIIPETKPRPVSLGPLTSSPLAPPRAEVPSPKADSRPTERPYDFLKADNQNPLGIPNSKPSEPAKPEVNRDSKPRTLPPEPKPTESPKPTSSPKPTDSPKPTSSPKPTDSPKPTSSPKPTDISKRPLPEPKVTATAVKPQEVVAPSSPKPEKPVPAPEKPVAVSAPETKEITADRPFDFLKADQTNSPTPSSPTVVTTPKGSRMSIYGSIKTSTCHVCKKAVYNMDELKADGLTFHKSCFRCKECASVLKLGNYASMNYEFFCKNCFKRNFFSKGNYSEGFGKLKPQQEFEAKQRGDSSAPQPISVAEVKVEEPKPTVVEQPKPVQAKPAMKPTAKPTGKPTGKPIGKPTGKPIGKPVKPTAKPSETKPVEPVEVKPVEVTPEPVVPVETQPEETQPEETQPEETQPEETQPEETQPEETQPEETQPEETQPQEVAPEDDDDDNNAAPLIITYYSDSDDENPQPPQEPTPVEPETPTPVEPTPVEPEAPKEEDNTNNSTNSQEKSEKSMSPSSLRRMVSKQKSNQDMKKLSLRFQKMHQDFVRETSQETIPVDSPSKSFENLSPRSYSIRLMIINFEEKEQEVTLQFESASKVDLISLKSAIYQNLGLEDDFEMQYNDPSNKKPKFAPIKAKDLDNLRSGETIKLKKLKGKKGK